MKILIVNLANIYNRTICSEISLKQRTVQKWNKIIAHFISKKAFSSGYYL